MKPVIKTCSGQYFDLLEPEKCSVDIQDIAHALSNTCRYGGHCRWFYSVAEHSVLVSRIVPPEHALAGLLHDAAEAFIGDVTSPLKQQLRDYHAIEERIQAHILRTFGLGPDLPDCVKHADLVALTTEHMQLFESTDEDGNPGFWPRDIDPVPYEIQAYSPMLARGIFLREFMILMEKRRYH